jgi:AIPR protein
MEINKHIIDQRIAKIVQDLPQWFEKSNDTHQKKSKAFVLLSVASYLGLELEEANHLMTEGGNDAGVDAIFIGDLNDYEFPVILFQGKYTFNLDKQTNFPANAIQTIIGAVNSIFDPSKPLLMNELLKSKVSEVRSLISDGYIPNVKCICVNNGLTWTQAGNQHIENAGFPANQVQFEYFNHDDIVKLLQTKKGVRATLPFAGKSLVDDFNYKRVLIGKVNVVAFAQLFEKYGDLLLEKNIRRYLGFHKNRVNESIKETLTGDKKENFYFYNNGITIVCNKFSYNALQGSDWNVTMEDLQIINGGQSCKTIQQTIKNHPEIDYSQVYVLVRLYELSGANVANMISDITIATNSQNPVDLRDLRANDTLQSALSLAIKGLGYHYKTKKDMMSAGNGENIPSSVLAESVFTIWREKPHLAKFKKTELFGKFYELIFNDLNAAQAILAVLIYRFCDNQRRNASLYVAHPHLPYSNYFLAMLMGRLLLERLKLKLPQLTHQEFDRAKQYLEMNKETLFLDANALLESVLLQWFPKGLNEMEPRRLSAAFRRGDVLNDLL